MNPISIRLLNQQLSCPQFDNPVEVVSHMGAIQAQEYRLMRWAVEMRTRRPSAVAFKQAYDSGKIVRSHLMRGTWQLVSAEDYAWMIELFAPRVIKVFNGWMKANGISIEEKEYDRISELLARAAACKSSVTKEDFVEALAENDIRMDDHRLSYHIRYAELKSILCSGELLPMKASYSLVSSKLGPQPQIDQDEALSILARKYFQSHSPATLEDFVWWSGLSVGVCKKAIDSLGGWIQREPFGDRQFLIGESCRTRGFRDGLTLLLPSYDEYLIGYKSRDIVLAPEHSHRAHNNSGNFTPVIVRDGIVCGNWKPFGKCLETDFFPDFAIPANMDASLSDEWERYCAFLSGKNN